MRQATGLLLLFLVLLSGVLHAEQVVILDRQYTHTAEGDDDKYMGFAIMGPEDGLPYNLVDPVNYAAGTAYFRLTVLSRPSEEPLYYQFCFSRYHSYGFEECCSAREMITSTGVYEWSEPIPQWWQPDSEWLHFDFTRKVTRIMAVCWGRINYHYTILDDRWGYGTTLTPEIIADFYPMEVRFQVVVVSPEGTFEGFPGDVAVEEYEQPSFKVLPAYPNPFNAVTKIRYELPESSHVTLSIYDVLGRKITSLVDNAQSAGIHESVWNGMDENGEMTGNGIYFYRITAGNDEQSGRMLLLK